MKDCLFKYLPPERIDVLENMKIRFTSVVSLNDPYESLMRLGDVNAFVDHKRGDNGFKFVSLSRNNANLLMWSHYSASHEGYVLAFDRNHSFFSTAQAVRYRRIRANFNGAKMSCCSKEDVLKQVVLEKAVDWAYEEEERLFLQDTPDSAVNIGNDKWGQPITLNSIPEDCILGVYLGVKASEEFKKQIIEVLKKHTNHIPLFQFSTKSTEFALETKEVLYAIQET
ncbi:hypothetical protein CXF80_17080 [Shewanella sp. Actino-trap-3]|jgi:hypothetical protein|nr:hypothetical protein CXF80_17080 [Shewanella sp. Actino-trap-3]